MKAIKAHTLAFYYSEIIDSNQLPNRYAVQSIYFGLIKYRWKPKHTTLRVITPTSSDDYTPIIKYMS